MSQLDISDEERLPELDKYSRPASDASGPLQAMAAATEGRLLGLSKAQILRRKIAMAELELSKCKTELELAAIDEDAPGESVNSPQDLPSQALPMSFGGQPNPHNPAPMAAAPPMPSCSTESSLSHLLKLCMGLPQKEIPRFSGKPLEYCGFIRAFTSGVA